MKLFNCPTCSNIVHFESRVCAGCGTHLAYNPRGIAMIAWKDAPPRLCASAARGACNWITEDHEEFGLVCRHPERLSNAGRVSWQELEAAKHRLFYSLVRWKLPIKTRAEDPEHGLIFHFLADDPSSSAKVMTGHDNGVITIALAEADAIERERRRLEDRHCLVAVRLRLEQRH